MIELQRLTTDYVDSEDRIRVTGEVANQSAQVLWLTRRLLDRLVVQLMLGLEQQQGGMPHADLLLGFAQQSAQSQLLPQAPVQMMPDSKAWLVCSVNISGNVEQVQLTFVDSAGHMASVSFSALALRQWLGIVHQAYCVARWPLDVWPQWMADATVSKPEQTQVWH